MKKFVFSLLLFVCAATVNGQLLINEFSRNSLQKTDEEGLYHPYIEIINTHPRPYNLGNFRLGSSTNSSIALPNISMQPGAIVLIWLSLKNEIDSDSVIHVLMPLTGEESYFELLETETQASSKFEFSFRTENEIVARFPDGGPDVYYSPSQNATPGEANANPGPWRKMASQSLFSPRDSSPNACLVFQDHVWILGGWKAAPDFNFWSVAEVFRSADGVHWELVSSEAPFSPYSGYVVFKNKMWAFGSDSYYSENGINWTKVQTELPFPQDAYLKEGIRVREFQNSLFAFYEDKIWKSENGHEWIEVAIVPWDVRYNPNIVVFQNRLWYFGGGNYYYTGFDTYYNDIWSSVDGITWTLEKEHAEWEGRYWSTAQVVDDKIFFMGGWNFHDWSNPKAGNSNDVWFTENGKDWNEASFSTIWEPRHASLSFVFKNSLWISGGYGTQGYASLYNDIWRLELQNKKVFVSASTLTYGDVDQKLFVKSSSGLPLDVMEFDPAVLKSSKNGFAALQSGTTYLHIKSISEVDDFYSPPIDTLIAIKINKRQLHVSALDATREFGSNEINFEIAYDGFVFNDGPEQLDYAPSARSDAQLNSFPGDYIIEVESGGEDDNYELIFENGTLTVTQPAGLNVFPNPSEGEVITFMIENPKYLRVYNISGLLQLETSVSAPGGPVDISSLTPGSYLFRLTTEDNQVLYGRFVKTN